MRYFVEEKEADVATPKKATQDVLDLVGVWSDLDWEEMEKSLDLIRHQTPPSPPLAL